MAGTITYNPISDKLNLTTIFRATNGGTVFSTNLTAQTNFDLFTDTAVANDAIYFGMSSTTFSDLYFDIGTQLSGSNVVIVWEYYSGIVPSEIRDFLTTPSDWSTAKWRSIEDLQDDTNGFTTSGQNTVKFPLQLFTNLVTINSTSNIWVRCRISSLTSITEGGANQTTRVKTNYGRVYVEGYTELSPCSFNKLSDWLTTNVSYLSPTKLGTNHFDYKKIALYISSPLLTKNETIEIGNYCISGNQRSSKNYLNYIISGEKSGNDSGFNGSTFIMYGNVNNDDILNMSKYSKVYGSTFKSRRGINYPTGYHTIDGEWINNIFEANFRFSNSLNGTGNIFFVPGTLIIEVDFDGDIFYENTFILKLNKFGNLYGASRSLYNIIWKYQSNYSGFLFNLYQSTIPKSYSFYDCTTLPSLKAIPLNGDPNVMTHTEYNIVEIDRGGGKVFFYNSTAGTYTDYTSAIKTDGTGNVPINGNVGDCLYWSDTTGTYSQGHELVFIVPNSQTSNDYEYVFEYYSSGSWLTWGTYSTTRVIDKTENFTKNGNILLLNKSASNNVTTVNSYSASWKRIRITKKGTGSPVITTMTHYFNSLGPSWCCDYSFDEYYSAIFNIYDVNLNPIENANVIITNDEGTEVYNKNTDSSGTTESGYIQTRKIMFDDDADLSLSPQYLGRAKEINYNDFNVIISAVGYESQSFKMNINNKINLNISLKKQKQIVVSNNGIYINTDPKNLTDTLSLIKI